MLKYEEQVKYYVSRLVGKTYDDAFHGLLELPPDALDRMIDLFYREKSDEVRAAIVKVVWHYRRPETVEFLKSALSDSSNEVWREAINGLVTIGNLEARATLVDALHNVNAKQKNSEFIVNYLSEAIEQIPLGAVLPSKNENENLP